MTGLKLSFFGGLGIHDARTGTSFDLPTRKSRALLAYLALAPGATRSREQIAGTLWERSAEEQARASLRQTLSTLRKAFAHAPTRIIQADGDLISLEPTAIEVDALRFERLAAERTPLALADAVALYRGQLLEGFSLNEERFEQWLAAERRRFHGLAVQAMADLLGHTAQGDDVARAIQLAEHLLALDPLQEWAHCTLMRLHWKSGRRESSLRQYQECVRVLDRELGIAPAEATQQLAAQIAREPAAVAAVVATAPARAPRRDETNGGAEDVARTTEPRPWSTGARCLRCGRPSASSSPCCVPASASAATTQKPRWSASMLR